MRIIYAYCSAIYEGRGSTMLPAHNRFIIIKDDNAVMIHNNKGIKPLNYMGANKNGYNEHSMDNGERVLVFDSNKESLMITLHKVFSDSNFVDLTDDDDPGLEKDGTEFQLQEWLSFNLDNLIPHYTFIEREHNTGVGAVDLYACRKEDKTPLLIEVKRVATRDAVYQVRRYLDEYTSTVDNTTKALIIALNIRPIAKEFATKKNIAWIELDWHKGEIKDSWFPKDF